MATAAVIGGVLAAGATTASYFEQKKTARKVEREQKEANDISSASAQVENARRRRRAIAQARMAQAQNLANAGGSMQNSSAITGTNAGLATQLGANMGTQGANISTQTALQGQQQKIADIQTDGALRAGIWQGLGNIAMTAGTAASGVQNA